MNGKQITICFHVDDCKISHASTKVVDESIDWLPAKYESIFEDGLGEMKVHRGKVHKYLGMSLYFSHKGQCCVTMYDYLDGILEAFDEAVKKHGEVYITVNKRHCVKTAAPTDDLHHHHSMQVNRDDHTFSSNNCMETKVHSAKI